MGYAPCFAGYEIDLARREIRRTGALVQPPLTPLRLSLCLAEHRGHTMGRQERRGPAWPAINEVRAKYLPSSLAASPRMSDAPLAGTEPGWR